MHNDNIHCVFDLVATEEEVAPPAEAPASQNIGTVAICMLTTVGLGILILDAVTLDKEIQRLKIGLGWIKLTLRDVCGARNK